MKKKDSVRETILEQQYRRKVITVLTLTIILFALILLGLIKVIVDEKKADTQEAVFSYLLILIILKKIFC